MQPGAVMCKLVGVTSGVFLSSCLSKAKDGMTVSCDEKKEVFWIEEMGLQEMCCDSRVDDEAGLAEPTYRQRGTIRMHGKEFH